jgi:hypothetical protein
MDSLLHFLRNLSFLFCYEDQTLPFNHIQILAAYSINHPLLITKLHIWYSIFSTAQAVHEKLSPSCFLLPTHFAIPQLDPQPRFRMIHLLHYERKKNPLESSERTIKTSYYLVRSKFHNISVDSQRHPSTFSPYLKSMDFFFVQAQTRAKSIVARLFRYQILCAFLSI